MPLVDGKWVPTTEEDLAAFDRMDELIDVGMSPEIEARLDAALERARVAVEPPLSVLVEGNRRLYPQLERVLAKGQGTVDIVVPVHNAWHITRTCIKRVQSRTRWPYALTVVDDASDERTAGELEALALGPLPMTLLRNSKNRGFAASVNRGIRAGNGEYVCLLNSDVLVTPGWLTKMVLALESDERNAIVCPATNNTAVVEIPMSPGASYLQMARAFEEYAERRYPEILPTGFCFLFRRSLLDEVGYFDEGFRDFGEETAFWWQCVKRGYRAVMADDTYVFHERASSYSALGQEKHSAYRRLASGRFNTLHPEWVEWRDRYDVKAALGPLRRPVPASALRRPSDLYRVAWIVRDARACGAMRYIADLCNELVERGVDAKVVVLPRAGQSVPEEWLGELRSAPVFFRDEAELLEGFAGRVFANGLVIAGTVELAPAVRALVDAGGGGIHGCLHAQSFDPALAKDPKDVEHLKALYKLLPDVISSSGWVSQEIAACGPTPFATIHPGVDRTLFYPRDRSAGDERPTVMIPMNPSVWWRGWDRGLELIQELEKQADARGIDLRILVVGAETLPIVSRAICLGTVTQTRMAQLLGTEVDALVDPSHVHSYGMPAIEAAACEVEALCWENRGVLEYGPLDKIKVPTTGLDIPNMAACAIVAAQVPLSYEQDAEPVLRHHDREKSCSAFIEAIEKHFKLRRKLRRICIVAPHLRKWGGPTTMLHIAHQLAKRGHSVEVATVYEDVAPDIAAMAEVPIRKAPKHLPEADLYITNSDNPWVDQISGATGNEKAIMLKLSHNPRFKREEEKGLQNAWDAIVTSTQWLNDVCETPTPGWDYLPHPNKATVIGWWHYEHARFRCPPSERTYGDGSAERPFVIGTLIHAHPTKGTQEALDALSKLHTEYHYRFIGVGEVPPRAVRLPQGWEYVFEPTRDQLAALMKQMDVWVSASKSEGLGRMTLEAMSAGCAVVARDTGGPHLSTGARVAFVTEEIPVNIAELLTKPEIAARHRAGGFETAERAADPEPCINALEEVIDGIFE